MIDDDDEEGDDEVKTQKKQSDMLFVRGERPLCMSLSLLICGRRFCCAHLSPTYLNNEHSSITCWSLANQEERNIHAYSCHDQTNKS
jgi:hypothetical protein